MNAPISALAQPFVAARPGVPGRAQLGPEQHPGRPSRVARSLATHLAGSWISTRGSCRLPVTSRSGRRPGGTLSYGLYERR